MALLDSAQSMPLPVSEEVHTIIATQQGRRLALHLGFSAVQQTALCTAILEIARNIVKYAGSGEITLEIVTTMDGRSGVRVVARDNGPGIPDITLAMRDGYSTGGTLGLGLPGARRLMDDFDVQSEPGQGTIITMTKWQAHP